MSIDDQLQKEAEQVVRLAGRKHFKEKLKNLEVGNSGPGQVKPRNKTWRLISILTAAAVLIFLPFWWMQVNKPSSGKDLFTSYFEKYRSPENSRGNVSNTETLWVSGVNFYKYGNYTSAALSFEELAQNDNSYLVQYYLGQSLLNLGIDKAEAAANAFNKVLLTEHDYSQQARWYLALAYLKAENLVEAKRVLGYIADFEGHYQKEKAEKLIKQLKLLPHPEDK